MIQINITNAKKSAHSEKPENSQVSGRNSVRRKSKNDQEEDKQIQTKNVKVQTETEYESNIEKENE